MRKLTTLIISIFALFGITCSVSAASYMDLAKEVKNIQTGILLLAIFFCVMVLMEVIFRLLIFKRKKIRGKYIRRSANQRFVLSMMNLVLVVILLAGAFGGYRYITTDALRAEALLQAQQTTPPPSTTDTEPVPTDTVPTEPVPTQTQPVVTEPPVTEPVRQPLNPAYTENSDPANWNIRWDVIVDNKVVTDYQREEEIYFGDPEDFFALPGISTFRGDNYRNNAAYGTAEVSEGTLSKIWSKSIGSLNGWPGSGWTGQPLVVKWDEETKQIMNLYDEKKAKKDLVEVIHATLDGKVYFYDLDDGSYTRKPINLGMNFKGAGSIDPRGYPILYLGAGDYIGNTPPKMYIVSLIDGSILYKRLGPDSMDLRNWGCLDSSPVVHGESDTLFYPCENGMLFSLKLNTQYDKAAGTLTMEPEMAVKTRYRTKTSNVYNHWVGYESSATVVENYMYISENDGKYFCIDLNTMELKWAQDTKDDSNSTTVFEWGKDGNGYLYTAPSLHWTAKNGKGTISIYKLNAQTGDIVWEVPFDVFTVSQLSGGVQASPILGKAGTELEGLVIYNIARTRHVNGGTLVALDTETGEIKWLTKLDHYSWSSPTAIYGEDGKAHIVVGDYAGNFMLFNAKGERVSSINLGGNIEASPVVYNDMIVVGIRRQKVFGIKIQ